MAEFFNANIFMLLILLQKVITPSFFSLFKAHNAFSGETNLCSL